MTLEVTLRELESKLCSDLRQNPNSDNSVSCEDSYRTNSHWTRNMRMRSAKYKNRIR